MIDLEPALADLAEHLDHPTGSELPAAVLQRISEPSATNRHRLPRSRALLAVAAAIVVIVGTLLAIAPARRAIADWLGIGAVQVRVGDHPLPTATGALTVPGAPDATPSGAVAQRLAKARAAVAFPISTPRGTAAGALLGVDADRRIPGGLVALRYPHFSLVEIASPVNGPGVGKILDPLATIEAVRVGGEPGMWIGRAHEIGYLDRAGEFRTDTVRRSGPVLMWARAGVTYRIEGLTRLSDAQAIAASLR